MYKVACVSVKIMALTIINMKMKMKKRSHRYDINTLRSKHGQKYTKDKNFLSMMMLNMY